MIRQNIFLRVYTILILLLVFILSGCTLFSAPQSFMKIDSRANDIKLPKKTPEMINVVAQKNKDILDAYKLKGKLEELKSLNIIKEAKIKKNKIEVNFIAKDKKEKKEKNQSIEKILWENSLFLLYTIIDTFPDMEKINLESDYYFLDQYGNPYKESIFFLSVNRKQIEKINRNYFRPNMLANFVDYYIAPSVKKEKKSKK